MGPSSVVHVVVLCVAALVSAGCGGGTVTSGSASTGTGGLSGFVVKGPVAGGKVTAYRLGADYRRGEALTSSTTQPTGGFSLSLPSYNGHLLLVVSSGGFVDEATGATVRVDGHELTAVVPGYRAGTELSEISINAVTHWVAQLASFYVSKGKVGLESAVADARLHLHGHFGDLDWSRVVPTDFNVAAGVTLAGDAERAGLLNAGLSQQALGIALTAGITPGGSINALTLIAALGEDLAADGYFDGLGLKGTLKLPADGQVGSAERSTTQLGGQTVRLALATALSSFLEGAHNVSQIRPADALGFANALSGNPDLTLFRTVGSGFDDAAPIVTLAGTQDRYQNTPILTFTAQADDGSGGSGVKAVYARSGDTVVTGVLQDGQWSLSGLTLSPGANTVTVWAEDKAAHGGRGQGAPFEISFRVFFDDLPPSALWVPYASYFDERVMQVRRNSGAIILPAQWFFEGVAKTEASNGVFKTVARGDWGPSAPNAASLEGDNPFNTPFIQVAVPFNANTDAPLAKVEYCFAASCGPAVAAAKTAPGQRLFDLPISSSNVAEIAQAKSSPIALPLKVRLEDAAGNQSEAELGTLSYNLVGSPVLAVRVTEYEATSDDPRSARYYSLVRGNFLDLYRRSNPHLADGHGVRFQRYILKNPAPVPVTVVIDTVGGAAVRTTIAERVFQPTPVAENRFVAPDGTEWPVVRTFNVSPQLSCTAEAYPCSSIEPNDIRPARVRGSSTFCNAFHPQPDAASTQQANLAFVAQAFVSTGSPLSDTQLILGPTPGPYAITVPPATDTLPGVVNLYLTRPHQESFLDFSVADYGLGRASPQRWVFDAWNRSSDLTPCCFGGLCLQYRASRWVSELVGSKERLTGTLRVRSHPSLGGLGLVGLPGTLFEAPVDVTVDH